MTHPVDCQNEQNLGHVQANLGPGRPLFIAIASDILEEGRRVI